MSLDDVALSTTLDGRLAELSGRSVLLATRDALAAALTLAELDGVVRRLIICPPDLSPAHFPYVIAKGSVDAIVSDHDVPDQRCAGVSLRIKCGISPTAASGRQLDRHTTEWVLLTSGTTGTPKMVAHTFAGLTAAITSDRRWDADLVWGTFYDIRRYGGLQILLRALLGGRSLVLPGAGEAIGAFLSRLAAHAVTHISGTPSHWRRALMSPPARSLTPRYIRLSGEIADQALLNALGLFYPQAAVGHAFASTEAGVGFEVTDRLEGFPASLVDAHGDTGLKIEDGSLRIRSAGTARRLVGEQCEAVADAEGFVDTGDIVERLGDRYYFLGRKSGVMNIGGLKVYPEEVEAAINRHPAVRMSMVQSRRSPITGSVVAADVVLRGEAEPSDTQGRLADLKREILEICHDILSPHKIPASIRFVTALAVSPAGKIARHHA